MMSCGEQLTELELQTKRYQDRNGGDYPSCFDCVDFVKLGYQRSDTEFRNRDLCRLYVKPVTGEEMICKRFVYRFGSEEEY